MNSTNISKEEGIIKLHKDLKSAVATMTVDEARFLVDSYYQMQENRLRAAGQIRSVKAEPHAVLSWLENNSESLENQIKNALKAFAESQPMGVWAMNVCGIGPVLAAGLIAHIDITKAPTVGHIWRFAGLDSTAQWKGTEECLSWVKANGGATEELIAAAARHFGKAEETVRKFATTDKDGKAVRLTDTTLAKSLSRRPHNAALKVICWKIGESFVKVKNNAEDQYGKLYETRKAYETEQNEQGKYAAQAAAVLKSRPTHAQKKIYKEGKLPPGHLHARAKRYAVKQFLSDWHAEAYRQHFKTEPPLPYPIAILQHAHLRKAA